MSDVEENWDEPQPAAYNPDVGYIKYGEDVDPQDRSLLEIFEAIKNGAVKNQVAAIQKRWSDTPPGKSAKGGDLQKDAVAPLKLKLPGALFSGTFSYRNNSSIVRHSGLICADIDGIPSKVPEIKKALGADPHTIGVFVSPTNTGVKAVFRCDPEHKHLESFRALDRYMREKYDIVIDQKCKEPARICFLSYDPEIIVKSDAQIIPYSKPEVEKSKPARTPDASSPFDAFNEWATRTGWMAQAMRAKGYSHKYDDFWYRPGKTEGSHSVALHDGSLLHVFSESPQTGLPSDKDNFSAFDLLMHWENGGDRAAAIKDVERRGLVKPRQVNGYHPKPEPGERFRTEQTAKPFSADDLIDRRVELEHPPEEPKTRLFLAEKPVCTGGNITTIISRAKTGKTTTIGAAVSAIVAAHYDRSNVDTFGFTASHTREAVIHIDTEQSRYDAYLSQSRALTRASQSTRPPWLMHYALVGFSVEKMADSLLHLLEKGKADFGGIFTVILDGVADFVNSVNDEVECNRFVAWLQMLAVKYDTPIICVIHSNEGLKNGDDGRGHLGKQLTRKAESNLLLKKTGDVTTITSEKQRKAPITEQDGIAFRWDDAAQMHVSCQPNDLPKKSKGGKPKEFFFDDFTEAFRQAIKSALTRQALYRFAKEIKPISETAFRDVLDEGMSRGELERTSQYGAFYYRFLVPGAK